MREHICVNEESEGGGSEERMKGGVTRTREKKDRLGSEMGSKSMQSFVIIPTEKESIRLIDLDRTVGTWWSVSGPRSTD